MKPYDVIKYPFISEKVSARIETDNTLVFVVDKRATKPMIKRAIEELYKMKVEYVRTAITSDGIKKAYVKFSKDTPALDLATRLGVL